MENLAEKYVNRKGVNEGRIVLHSDLNNFFASVECKNRPELSSLPVAVCGSREDRHGIVLAKNELAKRCGVKTAEAIWQAKQKCPHLVIVPPDYDEYVRYSRMVKDIYCEYTDRVESFGIDEAWLELTGDYKIKTLYDGERIAEEIRKRVKQKTGLTVSVGVSDNKIFSKLASDFKKPDAVTVFGPHNFSDTVSTLDIGDVIFVGRSTRTKLASYGIRTIGQAASKDMCFMRSVFGKNGESLLLNVSGANMSPVSVIGENDAAKSVGNSVTLPSDLENIHQVNNVIAALSEKVAYRLRSACLSAKGVCVSVRNTSLVTTEKQAQMTVTSNAVEIAKAAMTLYERNFDVTKPVRSLGVRTINLVSSNSAVQLDMFDNSHLRSEKLSRIDVASDKMREKYGVGVITHVSAMNCKMSEHNVTSFAHGL